MNMKKLSIYLILVFAAAFAACNSDNNGSGGPGDSLNADPATAKLQKENADLQAELQARQAAVDSFVFAFNEIQDNLNTIKEKEKIVANASKEGSAKKMEDQIIEDIQTIYELMEKNRQKVNALNSKLKKANVKIEELEKMIANLNTQLQAKDVEIAELKSKLEKMDIEINELMLASAVKDQKIAEQTDKMNTAYYAYGTAKELKRQGVITKEGGFIGIGKNEAMMKDFNKNYFTRIDITQTTSVPLAAKKAKLLTTHPSGSFKFEGPEGKVEKLVITNPEEFWSASKYLVVIIE
jgi:peptidoglycan hydrolase CwlO-like protein